MYIDYGPLSTLYYDLSKPIGHSLDGDIEFYREQLADISGTILEPAVGTGRILVPLLQAGFDIEGLDNSAFMLEKCQQNCQQYGQLAQLYQADMTSFNLVKRYDAIIIPTGSFCLITDFQQAKKALKACYMHLNKGAKLIVDLDFPMQWKDQKETVYSLPINAQKGLLLTARQQAISWHTQTTEQLLKYELYEKGVLTQTELQRFVLRWYGLEEFRLLLNSIGFTKVRCCADYDWSKPAQQAMNTVTFEAIKA
ncbi:class I SAM-dependent methyltransferase [Pseudomonas sp. F1_0610]|uniref:class I SAM-dependent methyltransferase n=1 Tax=Pseudomonas sp. F1_0610 TaxID=3114284 RepID=UPI0039C2DEAD